MNPPHKDYAGAKLGMWLFLFTEVLLFGGLFVLYSVYLSRYHPDFHHAHMELDKVMGTANTVVLITSSLFMALGVVAIQKGESRRCQQFLALTIALAMVFLTIKYFEWSAKFHHGLYPGSEAMAQRPPGEMIFFALYFTMTGLHGVHVVVGASLLGWVLARVRSGKTHAGDFVLVENSGLYWHLVDLVWIYLFPLFYLIA